VNKMKTNALLMSIVGGAFGFSMLVGPQLASATEGYYQTRGMRGDLRYDRHNCSAWCGESQFLGTAWRSSATSRTLNAQVYGDSMSGGGTAHVRAHAGCKRSNSDIALNRSAWSSGDERRSTTCATTHPTVTGWDCEIELADFCADL
jgi:hypothetical protein